MQFSNRKTKKAIQYVFLIFLIFLTIYLVFKELDIKMLKHVISIVDKKYILLGVVCIAIYTLIEGIVFKILLNNIAKLNKKFIEYKLAIMGFYYNLITPFASGSQPVQVYVLNQYKVPLSKGIAIVTNKTIIFQFVVTLYSSLLVLFNLKLLKSEMAGIMIMVILGIVINVITISLIVGVVYSPSAVRKYTKLLIRFFAKFKYLKFLQNKEEQIEVFIEEYSYSASLFIKNKKLFLITIFLTFLQLTAYFSIAYCVYRAFNLSSHTYVYLLTLQVFLYIAISPIPTPGNIGANEVAFFTIFSKIFPKKLIGYGVILYSGFVYYLILILSGVFTILVHYKMKRYMNQWTQNDREYFDVQSELEL